MERVKGEGGRWARESKKGKKNVWCWLFAGIATAGIDDMVTEVTPIEENLMVYAR